jgi:cobalt-zinc-cadmium efflux system membrane fusion protein
MQASRSSRRIFPDIGKHFRSFRTFRACGSFSGNSGSPSTHAETLPTHPAALRPCAETLPTHPADFRLCAETFPGSPADFRPRAETFPKHPADFRPCAETFPKRPADFRLCTETFPNGSADFPLVRKSFRADCFAERQRSRVGFAFCGDFACSVSAPDSQDSPDSPGAQLFRGDVSVGSRIAVVLNYAVRSINMLILAVLAAVAVSCGSDIPDSTPAPSPLNDSIIASLPKTVVHSREISRELRLNGRIVPDETRQANVYALVSGRAGQIGVELGDRVRKNQTLAVLKSAEVAAVSSELATAGSNLEIARKNREVYGELYGSGLASVREHASAVAEYEKALSELRKAEDVAAITGGENSFCRLVSPIDGYICAKNITGNSEVRSDMADPLFSIADLSVVWIIVDVYEADIASVRNGQAASVHTLSNPDRIYESKIDRIYSVLDPETRTMKARISLANSDGSLMPGMFASVKLKINESRTAVAVPSKSLVFENGRMYVIVMNGDGCPEIRPVREILRSDETSYLEGIADGETVITGSQIFLFEILNFEF